MAEATDVWVGISIVCRYDPKARTAAEHDRIYVGGWDSHPDKMMSGDRSDMDKMGWHWDTEFDTWRKFT